MNQTTDVVGRPVARTIIVALLSLLVVASTLPGLSLVWDSSNYSWGPQGPLGFSSDYDGVVKAVEPDSPATAAAIQPGDRIDFARTSPDVRHFVAGSPARVPVGRRVSFWIVRGGQGRLVTIVAPKLTLPLVAKISLVARTLAAIIFVIVGGMLVLLRPGPMTWGFFFYCLGFSPGIAFASFSRFPSATEHAVNVLGGDLLTAAGTAGILAFGLQFLTANPRPWRQFLERSIPYVFVTFALLITYPDFANLVLGRPAETVQRLMLGLQGIVLLLSIFAALQTYIRGRREDRPRIQWVIVGLCVGIAGTYLGAVLLFSSELHFNPPRWLSSSLLLLNVMLPIAVAYAVIRHHVLDVSFVVSRALIYAILTVLVFSAFAFIERLVTQGLTSARLASLIEIGLAVALSLWFKSLEKKLEVLVDTIFFRKRWLAIQRLDRDAEALHHANESKTVDGYLVNEPVTVLSLSSAALFRKTDNQSYERVVALGWPATTTTHIQHDDRLVLQLEAEWEPLRVSQIGWQRTDIPTGTAGPILAVPLVARRDLAGFLLYGAHANGADIDPDEQRSLFELGRSAQATYDHLRADELTDEVESLRAQLDALRRAQS